MSMEETMDKASKYDWMIEDIFNKWTKKRLICMLTRNIPEISKFGFNRKTGK